MAADSLDVLLPVYDANDVIVCDVPSGVRAAGWALRTYDLRAHAGALSRLLRLAQRALPTPPPQAARLVQLGCLSDAALKVSRSGQHMLLGFIGKIWQPGAQLRLPAEGDFAAEAERATHDACVVWRLDAVQRPEGGASGAQLRLSMRLRYPSRMPARWACAAYWHACRRGSVWARRQLLQSIARHAVSAPSAAAS